MSIVINTPTSNIGRALVARLTDAGKGVIVPSGDKKKFEELLRRGARIVQGSFEEKALIAKGALRRVGIPWITSSHVPHPFAPPSVEKARSFPRSLKNPLG
jgi:hypothetical protein